MKKMLSFVLLAAAVVAVAGCNPFAPSNGGYDPDKPLGTDNWPPGPCAHQPEAVCDASRASLHSFGVYEGGECDTSPFDCPRQIVSGGAGNFHRGQAYTAWLCVRHAGVPGRNLTLSGNHSIPKGSGVFQGPLLQTDEGGALSPVCLAFSFTPLVNGEGQIYVRFHFHESGQDLLSTVMQPNIVVTLTEQR